MKVLSHGVLPLLLLLTSFNNANAQCNSWVGNPRETEAKEAHVLYRQMVKGKTAADLAKLDDVSFGIIYDNWLKAYEIAPMADGQRANHYIDGVEIMKAKKEKSTDDAAKLAADKLIISLYDQLAVCYPKEIGYALSRKAFDMFYMPSYGYSAETAAAFKTAIEKAGNSAEYIILEPIGLIVKYMFKNKLMSSADARFLVEKSQEIADFNISNNEKYGQYYEASYARMEVPLAEVEGQIFDCDYFKAKLIPLYQENPEDLVTIRYTFNKLKTQGCADTDPIMLELKTKYEAKAANMNAAMQEDFLAKNPGMAARKLYEEGNFSQAIAKYQEALSTETDDSKKADYYLGIASIQFRQLKSYGPARENARKAASLKSNWGRPYLLIGDMYASTSRNCGSDGYSRGLAVLAAIEKYAQARNIDAEVSAEASKKISLYGASIPPKDEAHMRGIAEGARVSTGCWIGETVTLRYN